MDARSRHRTAVHVVMFAACAVALVVSACGGTSDDGRFPAVSVSFVMYADTSSPLYGSIDVMNLDSATLAEMERMDAEDQDWSEILAVYEGSEAPADSAAPMVAGTFGILLDRMRFNRRLPPVVGQPYYVRLDLGALDRSMDRPPRNGPAVFDTVLVIGQPPAGSPRS